VRIVPFELERYLRSHSGTTATYAAPDARGETVRTAGPAPRPSIRTQVIDKLVKPGTASRHRPCRHTALCAGPSVSTSDEAPRPKGVSLPSAEIVSHSCVGRPTSRAPMCPTGLGDVKPYVHRLKPTWGAVRAKAPCLTPEFITADSIRRRQEGDLQRRRRPCPRASHGGQHRRPATSASPVLEGTAPSGVSGASSGSAGEA